MTKYLGILALAVLGTSPAFAGTGYVCQSAETDPAVPFSVVVQTGVVPGINFDIALMADIAVTFPGSNPSVTEYKNVPYAGQFSGMDHVAFVGDGISVVVYPDPKTLSTIVIGDDGGTQVGLAMTCQPVSATK